MPKLTGNRNQCPTCREFFNSNGAFDKHRTGAFGKASGPSQRRCLKPDEMRAIGMTKNDAGFWIGSVLDDSALVRRRQAEKNARQAVSKRPRRRPQVPGVPTYASAPPAAPTREPKALKKEAKRS